MVMLIPDWLAALILAVVFGLTLLVLICVGDDAIG